MFHLLIITHVFFTFLTQDLSSFLGEENLNFHTFVLQYPWFRAPLTSSHIFTLCILDLSQWSCCPTVFPGNVVTDAPRRPLPSCPAGRQRQRIPIFQRTFQVRLRETPLKLWTDLVHWIKWSSYLYFWPFHKNDHIYPLFCHQGLSHYFWDRVSFSDVVRMTFYNISTINIWYKKVFPQFFCTVSEFVRPFFFSNLKDA